MLLSRRWCFLQPLLGPTRPQKALLLLVSRTIRVAALTLARPELCFWFRIVQKCWRGTLRGDTCRGQQYNCTTDCGTGWRDPTLMSV